MATLVPTPGVDCVPTSVSDTVTVSVVVPPSMIGFVPKAITVEVERLLTVRSELPLLPEWTEVALNVPVIVCRPAGDAAVIVTVHVDTPDVSVEARLQVPAMPSARTDEPMPTVPVGKDFVPFTSSSVTVAVTVVD